jgi:hypothetical protein
MLLHAPQARTLLAAAIQDRECMQKDQTSDSRLKNVVKRRVFLFYLNLVPL